MSAYGPAEEWICEVQHETPETPESRPFLILMHKLERKPRHRVGKALRDWVAKYGITGMDYRAIRIMDGCKMGGSQGERCGSWFRLMATR